MGDLKNMPNNQISNAAISKHLNCLCHDIGVRLAGSDDERQAADYITAQMRALGAAVTIEEFPVQERAVQSEHLEIRIAGKWRSFPCSLLSNTPGTDGKVLEGPLAFINAQTDYQRSDLAYLTDKAVLHFGSHIQTAEHYRRLMAARPKFLLFVDVRYPGSVVTADGMFPAYTAKYGAVPTVSIAYQDAWDFMTAGAQAAKLRVKGGMRASTSQNVIAELTGTDAAAGMIVFGAHHDTQADSVGAHDNGTGVAAIIELAGMLAKKKLRKTVRLISFGAEEQLSVGSAAYVRRHRRELAPNAGLMLNFDSFGSRLGWTTLEASNAKLANLLAGWLKKYDIYVMPAPDISPYGDHFPFVAAGMAAACIGRDNCAAGRFFHHRPDDDLSRVSCELAAQTVAAIGQGAALLAAEQGWPCTLQTETHLRRQVNRGWKEMFGGWSGWKIDKMDNKIQTNNF